MLVALDHLAAFFLSNNYLEVFDVVHVVAPLDQHPEGLLWVPLNLMKKVPLIHVPSHSGVTLLL